jgi:hypothetical protein
MRSGKYHYWFLGSTVKSSQVTNVLGFFLKQTSKNYGIPSKIFSFISKKKIFLQIQRITIMYIEFNLISLNSFFLFKYKLVKSKKLLLFFSIISKKKNISENSMN